MVKSFPTLLCTAFNSYNSRTCLNIIWGLFFLVATFNSFEVRSQEFRFPVTEYSPKQFKVSGNESWCAVQDSRNVMYFGYSEGLLEFDGLNWNFIPVKKNTWIYSLAVDNHGIIYIGAQEEFGYLAPDALGTFIYHSLSDQLKPEQMGFTKIWRTHVTAEGVVFQDEQKIFIYNNNKLSEIFPETTFHLSFLVNNELYVRQRNIGLMKLDKGKLVLVNNNALFAQTGVFALLPYSGNQLLVATYENGLWVFDPHDKQMQVRRLATADSDLTTIRGGVVLDDGNLAFNTDTKGVLIADMEGKILSIVNKNNGLRTDEIRQLYTDNQQNLWLITNNRLAKINYHTPFSYFSDESGFNGNIYAIARYNGLLYVGTSTGLYVQQDATSSRFVVVQGFNKHVWCLKAVENSLLIGTIDGLYEIVGGKLQFINYSNVQTIHYLPQKKLAFMGGAYGLSVYEKQKQWQLVKYFSETSSISIQTIAQSEAKLNVNIELWLGTQNKGAIKMELDQNMEAQITEYSFFSIGDLGLTQDWILPFMYNDSIIYGSNVGLLKLKISNQNNDSAYSYESFKLHDTVIKKPVYLFTETEKMLWLSVDNSILSYDKQKKLWIDKPFYEADKGQIRCIYPDVNGLCWFGAADGLVRCDANRLLLLQNPFHTILRKVSSSKDSMLFGGVFFKLSDSTNLNPEISLNQTDTFIPILKYKNNSIRFEFTAPFYTNEDKILFSYFLTGYDDNWSDWNHSAVKEYTNLPEGNYIFRVKAKNVFGDTSMETTYSFSIQPPWYRTPIAYLAYSLFGFIIIILTRQLSVYRLKRQNIWLEKIVAERTAEIAAKNVRLEEQKSKIEHQNREIIASIAYASRIQQALLPPPEEIKKYLSDYFVLFKPRDIVSGDFYWVNSLDNRFVVVAADCTGHGVPGAMMSMLGISFLNEIISKQLNLQANTILNLLRDEIIRSLRQSDRDNETKDGMDISLCIIDYEQKILQFSGAYNPLYHVRKNGDNYELNEVRADKMPIGIHRKKDVAFTCSEIPFEEGDTIYMLSDGYEDQFGGEHGKKFMSRNFKSLLLTIQDKNMVEQKQILKATIENWIAYPEEHGKPYEQIDDILVVGVKLNNCTMDN